MKILECDICGDKIENDRDLYKIRKEFKTRKVKEVCEECLCRVNDRKRKIRKMHRKKLKHQLKAFIMSERQERFDREESKSLIDILKRKGVF